MVLFVAVGSIKATENVELREEGKNTQFDVGRTDHSPKMTGCPKTIKLTKKSKISITTRLKMLPIEANLFA